MVMIAYFDESGTHGAESPAVTVAGFIANAVQWASYERQLAELMAEFRVAIFHAKDFRLRKRHFKEWTISKRAKFNSRFLRIAMTTWRVALLLL
jgi:hypothetical protein